jgi:site-specific recombinase XerD
MPTAKTTQTWSLASVALQDLYTDFILSRQAMNCTPVTMSFYRFTVGKFLEWIEQQGLTSPEQITARHVRQFLAELTNRGTGHHQARLRAANTKLPKVLAYRKLPTHPGPLRDAAPRKEAATRPHSRAA